MFNRFIKIIFTYFIISFSYVNYSQSQDLTKQEAIEKIIYFKGVVGESHYYEPSELIFYTGKLYKLTLLMRSKPIGSSEQINFYQCNYQYKGQVELELRKELILAY